MSALVKALRGRTGRRDGSPLAFQDFVDYFTFNGLQYPFVGGGTLQQEHEEAPSSFGGYVHQLYKSNGVVFACMAARQRVFSQARFQFQRMNNGTPGDLFGSALLKPLERPWGPSSTTSDLLARMILDADLGGDAFVARLAGGRLAHLRPDWVVIIAGSNSDPDTNPNWQLDAEVAGYVYMPGGPGHGQMELLMPENVAHFAPHPDPIQRFRGMSWLTPVVREVMGDSAASQHKLMFFQQGASPNIVVSASDQVTPENFQKFVDLFRDESEGVANAYRTLFVGGGANVSVVGSNLRQMDFKVTQGAGEPLALDTPVPTPSGWTTMGAVEVGDEVFGRDGLPIKVVDTSPVHTGRDCYRVTFSDRTAIVADAGHLWRVIDRNSTGPGHQRTESTKTTTDLIAGIAEWHARGTGGNRYGVPAGDPCELDSVDLLVDPYVLGAWLGDGQTAGAAICGAEPDIAFIQAEFERRGYTSRRWSTAPDRAAVFGVPGGLLAALDSLGVLGDKHIPAEYLRASLSQRLDLLRGLMDTDGTVGSIGKETCEYSSKWEHLARQVAELARSLGYRATLSRKAEPRSRTGATWRLTFRADPDIVPFLLERKVERCQTPVHVKNRAIVSIEAVPSVPVRCITVDSEDHLFRAGEGWTLTHNSRIAAAAGVPPIVVGLSEGLQYATYSNYAQARRAFADGTLTDLWQQAAGSLETLVDIRRLPNSDSARLWYDTRGIPFLRADAKEDAEVQQQKAATINSLITAGYEPDAAVKATNASDMSLLIGKHTGLVSVQLFPPGETPPGSGSLPAEGGGGTANGKANGKAQPALPPAK